MEPDPLDARRRAHALASFAYQPDQTWDGLSDAERHDKELVLKAAESGALGPDGRGWWEHHARYRADFVRPPPELMADRDVVLALASRKEMARELWSEVFAVPEGLRSDKEVMLAVCAKNCAALQLASSSLRDDPEVVRAALSDEAYYSKTAFQHASNRLRGDVAFITEEIERIERDHEHDYHDWEILKYMTVDIEAEKKIALAVLSHCKRIGEPTGGILDYFSFEVRDDKELMLKFIEDDPWNLQHCSDVLKACADVVAAVRAKNERATIHAAPALRPRSSQWKDKKSVMSALKDGELEFDLIPDAFKEDEDVLEEVILEEGAEILKKIPPHSLKSRRLVFAAAEACDPPEDFFDMIPDIWRKDEKLAMKLLDAEYFGWPEELLKIFPSLYQSREAMKKIAGIYLDGECGRLPNILKKSAFADDHDIMIRACCSDYDCIDLVSSRLMSDRNFVDDLISKMKDSIVLTRMSEEFMRNNVDLVVRAIEIHDSCTHPDEMLLGDDEVFSIFSGVWDLKQVVTACLKKGLDVFKTLLKEAPESPFFNDEEIVTLAATKHSSSFRFASMRLRSDRDFVSSLLKKDLDVLHYAWSSLRREDELLFIAIANNPGTMAQCFPLRRDQQVGDTDYLIGFASRIRSRLSQFDSYVTIFLAGISIQRLHVAPALRCHLPLLDRGIETSSGFKRLVAEFAGIPLNDEVRRLRLVSSRLQTFGF